MNPQKPEGKEFNLLRTILTIIVVIVWVTAIYCSFTRQYQIPSSVEIAFTVVLGFVFGTSTLPSIIKYWRNKDK
jgi:uncharacterized membrane protein